MELTRRQIREIALQSLFALSYDEEQLIEKTVDHVYELFLEDHHLGDEFSEMPTYLTQLVTAVCEKRAELDQLVVPHLRNWTIERLPKIDLMILRLATYEMLFVDEVPAKVSLNEAIELAKKYSEDRSRKFINGVLSALLPENASAE